MTAQPSPNPQRIRLHLPPLYPKQREFVDCQARFVVVEASTKVGKTVALLIWLLSKAWREGRPGRNYWWVAPYYPTARIAFRRLRRWLKAASTKASCELSTANETEMTITLLNGAVITFKSGEKPDGLFGEDVHAAVLDEATRMREEAWHAIRSTLTATRGPVRIIGNVKGRRNWAYNLARRAEEGAQGWSWFKLTAYDAIQGGVLSPEEVESARRDLPEAVFNELYLAIPSDDGSNPFGLTYIRKCLASLSEADPRCFGWDLAKSQDWTVGIGLDDGGRTSFFDRFQAPWEATIPRIKAGTGRNPALVDSTGVGDPIVERLRKEAGLNYEGYQFTGPSKQRLMEGLAVAIQQGEITFPDGPIRTELESFEFEYTRTAIRYSAPEGMHDDCVMALALAVAARSRPSVGRGWLEAWEQMLPATTVPTEPPRQVA